MEDRNRVAVELRSLVETPQLYFREDDEPEGQRRCFRTTETLLAGRINCAAWRNFGEATPLQRSVGGDWDSSGER